MIAVKNLERSIFFNGQIYNKNNIEEMLELFYGYIRELKVHDTFMDAYYSQHGDSPENVLRDMDDVFNVVNSVTWEDAIDEGYDMDYNTLYRQWEKLYSSTYSGKVVVTKKIKGKKNSLFYIGDKITIENVTNHKSL